MTSRLTENAKEMKLSNPHHMSSGFKLSNASSRAQSESGKFEAGSAQPHVFLFEENNSYQSNQYENFLDRDSKLKTIVNRNSDLSYY